MVLASRTMMKSKPNSLLLMAACVLSSVVYAADVDVRLANAPASGTLVFQVYDAADAFGDLRDPAKEFVLPAAGEGPYRLDGIEPGTIAVLAYVDANENGRIDKNFIGIPKEPLAISNNYRPKGPPSFSRASFDIDDELVEIDMTIYQVLGQRGRLGLGVGMIGRSSPYVGSTRPVTQAIPAVTYVGERLQWFGPALRYGIAGTGRVRLAAAAEYRIGAYEEADSPALAGLGNRQGTLLGGLGLQYEIAEGFELELLYQHDVLDRVGGGMASARLSRGIPWGVATFVPQVAWNWTSSDMTNHDFGVPVSAAAPGRPAYDLGSTTSLEVGIGVFVELTEDWRIIINAAAERLDSDVTASPIVDEDYVYKGFAVVSYVF